MARQEIWLVVKQISQNPLAVGCFCGMIGSYLVIVADSFMDTEMDFSLWGQKIVYIVSGTIVGGLINVTAPIGVFSTIVVAGIWPILVNSFGTAAKVLIDSLTRKR